jgi:hypothetical protein
MWVYLRRLTIHPIESNVTFAGVRLRVAPNGEILTPVSDELALKMKRAPHIFKFIKVIDVEAVEVQPAKVENVESSSAKDDNIDPKPKRKRRKKVEG